MKNIKEAIGKDSKNEYKTQETLKHIEEYKYDKFSTSNGKGDLIDVNTELINKD